MFRGSRSLLSSILKINAGGTIFETLKDTVTKYPESGLTAAINASADEDATKPVFVDVDPDVFRSILQFHRSGKMHLPTKDEALRSSVVHQLGEWGLLEHAFPSQQEVAEEGENIDPTAPPPVSVKLPDVCVVQLCDNMTHDTGVKRHAMTVTYGADGFRLRNLCKEIRRDLHTQVAKSYWQVHQTNERAVFFVSSKLNNATSDLLLTSVSQRVIEHTEKMGYSLQSSYVTLSPDVQHTKVRMFIHNFIFRRVREPVLEETDALALMGADGVLAGGQDEDMDAFDDTRFRNFEAPKVGPQGGFDERPPTVPPGERVGKIWD